MRRHLFSVIARSLNAIVRSFAREPPPFVTRWRSRAVANADSTTFVLRIDCQLAVEGRRCKLDIRDSVQYRVGPRSPQACDSFTSALEIDVRAAYRTV